MQFKDLSIGLLISTNRYTSLHVSISCLEFTVFPRTRKQLEQSILLTLSVLSWQGSSLEDLSLITSGAESVWLLDASSWLLQLSSKCSLLEEILDALLVAVSWSVWAKVLLWVSSFGLLTEHQLISVIAAGPIYIGELSPPEIRGAIMSFWQMFYSVGSFIA